jgi:hypothetical protein
MATTSIQRPGHGEIVPRGALPRNGLFHEYSAVAEGNLLARRIRVPVPPVCPEDLAR